MGGVPHPSSRRGADICVFEGSVARPISGHGVGNLWLLFCALFIFVRWSFPRKVLCQSSKSGLADPREKETCLSLCGKPCSEAGTLTSHCSLDHFLGPLFSLLPQAHQRQPGSCGRCCRRWPSALVCPGALAWVRGALSSLSAPPGHRQKGQALRSPVDGRRGLGWHRQAEGPGPGKGLCPAGVRKAVGT